MTDNLPAAQQFAHQMMAEYGAPVTFSDDPDVLPEDGLTFSPEGILPERNLPLLFPTQPSADTARAAPIFYSPKPVLPEQFTALTAKGWTAGLLEALYALERCKMLEKQGPASLYLRKNGETGKRNCPAEASRTCCSSSMKRGGCEIGAVLQKIYNFLAHPPLFFNAFVRFRLDRKAGFDYNTTYHKGYPSIFEAAGCKIRLFFYVDER